MLLDAFALGLIAQSPSHRRQTCGPPAGAATAVGFLLPVLNNPPT